MLPAFSWLRRNKALALAGVLTIGETYVNMGGTLPGSDSVPVWARASLIGLLTVAAMYYRWRATSGK